MTKIVYEPHPVSPERKEELRRMGARIIDGKFAPDDWDDGNITDGSGLGTDSGDQFTDEQLREAIEKATGKATHPAMKRENLIAKYNKLNAEQN